MIDAPVVSIHLPPLLRPWAGGNEAVIASGDTVGEALQALGHAYPDLVGKILRSNGQLQPGFDLYLGGTSVHVLQGIGTPIADAELISIIPCRPLAEGGDISVG